MSLETMSPEITKASGVCTKCGNFECTCEEGGALEAAPEQQAEAIRLEQERARENFQELINIVSERYDKLPPEMRKTFIEHNAEILAGVVELGIKKGLSKEELKLAEIAAIIHDMTKAEPDREGISNYTLAVHGGTAALEVDNVVTDETLEKAGIDISDKAAGTGARDKIRAAVRQHMGPHPGFMDGILAGVNASIQRKNKELIAGGNEPILLIEHPQAGGPVAETLLAADMGSLASGAGREKVMAIRANVPFFVGQDKATVAAYEDQGVTLRPGEAALLSGFDSARDAYNMLTSASDKQWLRKLIDQSKEEPYTYIDPDTRTSETVSWPEVMSKRIEFLSNWIVAEEDRIEGGEYRDEELNEAQKKLTRAQSDLGLARQELADWRQSH